MQTAKFINNPSENFGILRTKRKILNDNSWLILKLEGTSSNKPAFGTRIIAKAAINGKNVMQTREITPMSGHGTYNSTQVHFGLGDAAQVDTLIIRWPSGNVDKYLNIPANEIHQFIEKEEIACEGADFGGRIVTKTDMKTGKKL